MNATPVPDVAPASGYPFADHGMMPVDSATLAELIAARLVRAEDWEGLPFPVREEIAQCPDPEMLLPRLVRHGLLTEYQADRVQTGQSEELVLHHYRVLDRLAASGMGVVYRAEHIHLRRPVTVKVLPLPPEEDSLASRFAGTLRAFAGLTHPNIATALDAGTVPARDSHAPGLYYLVTEFTAGRNLSEHVQAHGPLPVAQACGLMFQLADALAKVHHHQLTHQGIKPSEVIVAPEGQTKLLDLGLASLFPMRLRTPSQAMLDYAAPEQIHDLGPGDIRADLYGLGGLLFLCLTGQAPYRRAGAALPDPRNPWTWQPRSPRALRPEIPEELEAVVRRLLAFRPEDRFPTPHAVMSALMPFLSEGTSSRCPIPAVPEPSQKQAAPIDERPSVERTHHVLVVDDEEEIRGLCRTILEAEGIRCDVAANGPEALRRVGARAYDLIVLDMAMPGLTGQEVCQKLRENPPTTHLKILLFSGHLASDDLAGMLAAGADDYVTKPFSIVQLLARIKAALRLKDAQDRAALLSHHLLGTNHLLEQNLHARDQDLLEAHKALVLALAKLVECRDTETGAHLQRLQAYCRCLAEEAAKLPAFADPLTTDFIRWLEWSAPLHDIGKAGIPDRILHKPGPLNPEERLIMQTHTVLGAETLKEVARQHGSGMAFLHVAIDVARHHHERYDGTGYPDQRTGTDIPLSARLLAVADVYDALRSRRVYKPSFSHVAALGVMLTESPGQFDPALLGAFQRCAPDFDRIFHERTD